MTDMRWLREELDRQPGSVSCWYRDLATGETFGYREDAVHPSASVIKIFLMAFLYQRIHDGALTPEQPVPFAPEQLAPSAGVLSYLRDLRELSLRDLTELMIIVSDNSATNILLDLAGKDALNLYLEKDLKLKSTRLRRRMMDLEAAARGEDNTTSALEAGLVLEKLYRGTLVSPEWDREMLRTLKNQQDSSLIPWYLDEVLPEHTVAHKTGGLEHVVHDAAVVGDPAGPYVLCFFGSGVFVPDFSRVIQDASRRIHQMRKKGTLV